MNRTIIININSIVFHIEEDAYETLRMYMIDIKKHFGKSEDSKEILEDIENRIAEMFSERIHSGKKEVITAEDVSEVISQMGRVSDFEGAVAEEDPEHRGQEERTEQENFQTQMPEPEYFAKKLMRDPDDKIFGGVCSGLSHYFGIESKWVRIIFVLFFLFAGSGVLLYVVLWVVMPLATNRADKMAMRGEAPNLQNFKKSFEKEMDGFRENFSGAGEHINRGARSVGDFIVGFFRILGKLIAFAGLVFCGLTLIGLFIFFISCSLNLMGYENPMNFPPLEILDSGAAFFALLAGLLAIGIPFLALFYLLLRVLFRIQSMNNYASLTLFTTWILSIIAILYFVITTAQDFRESSTISVEKRIEEKSAYVLSERDVRVINASDEDFSNKKFNINIDGRNLKDFLRSEVQIKIEPLDSLEKPYVQYRYSAKGRTYKQASDRASAIQYGMNQEGEKLTFDSHYSLSEKDIYRDQRVEVRVFLPVGSKVSIMNEMAYKVQGSVWIHNCNPDINNKSTEWIMTKNGLKCTTIKKEEKESEETKEEDATIESEESSDE